MPVAATAEHGRFLSTDDPDTILFRLTKGRLVQDSPKFATPRTLAFDIYDLPVNLPVDRPVPPPRRDRVRRALPARAVAASATAAAPTTRSSSSRRRRTFNFRLVEVLMMLMLPLLAVSLAVPPKRSSSALGIFLVDPDRRRLSQGQSICRSRRRRTARSTRSLALWTPLLVLVGDDPLDVPCPRPPARRPADRRARMVLRQDAARRIRALMPKRAEA